MGAPSRTSRAHGWGFDAEAARAPTHKPLEIDEFRRAAIERFGAHTNHAISHTAMQRTDALPSEPIQPVPSRLPLSDQVARERLVPMVVVASRTSGVQLSLELVEGLPSCGSEALVGRQVADR